MFYDEDSIERWEEDAWDAYCDSEEDDDDLYGPDPHADDPEYEWEFWDLTEEELKEKFPPAPPPQTMFKHPEFWRVMPEWVFESLVVNYIPPEEPY